MGLDFVEKSPDYFVRTLEVALGKAVGDEFLVSRWNIGHVVACSDDLSLVRRVLDVVL